MNTRQHSPNPLAHTWRLMDHTHSPSPLRSKGWRAGECMPFWPPAQRKKFGRCDNGEPNA